jgi:Domain of unknown function (DUF397)
MSPMDDGALSGGWRKAGRSVNNGQCVEVASGGAAVMVRDSVDPSSPVVGYPTRAWQAFLATAKAGTFDSLR